MSYSNERFIRAIVERIVIRRDEVEILIRNDALIHQLTGKMSPPFAAGQNVLRLACPFRHAFQGKAVRLIVGVEQQPPAASTLAILRAIARACTWRDQIIEGEASGIRDLARIHKLNHSYVKRIYSFASFSPASIEAILNGGAPPDISLDSLVRKIPLIWAKQHALVATATEVAAPH